jgi:uncharacterized surface protein with fasciclin (FAS1) repeats
VVAGKWDPKVLMDKIKVGKGTFATVTISDIYQSNRLIIVIDRVMMPN